jgi:hypothetical protein
MTLTDAHKKKRHGRITSTTGADAITKSQHGAARRILGVDDPDIEPTPPIFMLRGQYFEESICNLAERLMRDGTDYLEPQPGLKLHKVPFRVHRTLPWLGTSADRIAKVGDVAAGVVEAKSYLGATKDEFGTPGTDQVDERTFIQCVVHMAVLELPQCHVPLDTGFDFQIYRIQRDRELEDAVLVKLEAFWHEWIEPNIGLAMHKMKLPPVDGSDATLEWIKKRYKSHQEETLAPVRRHYDTALQLTEIKEQLAPLVEKKKVLENMIRDEIGATGSAGFRDDLLTMTWKAVKARTYVDWQEIAMKLGAGADLIKEHTKTAETYRRLYCKLKKDARQRLKQGDLTKLLEG